jgi:hypothetical protein
MIRFEILLPLFYNDGRRIEPEKFLETDDDFVHLFGAVSTDAVIVRGLWMYQSALYQDQLVRYRVDVDDSPETWDSMRNLKERLKVRFEQLDIWVTANRIEII